jgi:hypothetical protein
MALMSQKKRRIVAGVAFIAAVGLLLLTASGALAGGPPVVTESTHVINETSTDVDVYPCTWATGRDHTHRERSHPLPRVGRRDRPHHGDAPRHLLGRPPPRGRQIPDATGTTVAWFGGNGELLEGGAFCKAQTAFTLNIKGTNADGTTFGFNVNGNAVFDRSGTPKLGFSKESARCR